MATHNYQHIIPDLHPTRITLESIASKSRIIVISGLPGVGKSLYVHEMYNIIQNQGSNVCLIQWDQARKAFETDEIFEHYPMGDGVVHNGLKLIAGAWLLESLKSWWKENKDTDEKLLIEAPLVGHRFIELATPTEDKDLENILSSIETCFVVPIPTKEVRTSIEKARAQDVDEDSPEWFGAKPSVMQMLWEMTCDIAKELGKDLNGSIAYDPSVYQYVFSHVLKHRYFHPLIIDEIFDVPEQDDEALHSLECLMATEQEANKIGIEICDRYPDKTKIDAIVNNWFNT